MFLAFAAKAAVTLDAAHIEHRRKRIQSAYRRTLFRRLFALVTNNPIMPPNHRGGDLFRRGGLWLLWRKQQQHRISYRIRARTGHRPCARGNLCLAEKGALMRRAETIVLTIPASKPRFPLPSTGAVVQYRRSATAQGRDRPDPAGSRALGKPARSPRAGQRSGAGRIDRRAVIAAWDRDPRSDHGSRFGQAGSAAVGIGWLGNAVGRRCWRNKAAGDARDTVRVDSSGARLPEADRVLSTLDTLRMRPTDGPVPLGRGGRAAGDQDGPHL